MPPQPVLLRDLIQRELPLTDVLTCGRYSLPPAFGSGDGSLGTLAAAVDRCGAVQDQIRIQSRQPGLSDIPVQLRIFFQEFGDTADLLRRVTDQARVWGLGPDMTLGRFVSTFGWPQDEAVKARVIEQGRSMLGDTTPVQMTVLRPDQAISNSRLLSKYGLTARAFEMLDQAILANPGEASLFEAAIAICRQYARRDRLEAYTHSLAQLLAQRGDTGEAASLLESLSGSPETPPTVAPTGDDLPDRPATGHPVADGEQLMVVRMPKVLVFDVFQVLENGRHTAVVRLDAPDLSGVVCLEDGRIVDAFAGDDRGLDALRRLVALTEGTVTAGEYTGTFRATIQASSNTSLLLDLLREIDEANHEEGGWLDE
jgi:hypothetical protein